MKHVHIILAFVYLFSMSIASAQTDGFVLYNPVHVGGGFLTGYNVQSTNGTLRCLGDPACPTFEQGSGYRFGVMGIAEWMPTSWGLRTQLGIASSTSHMTTIDQKARVKNGKGAIVPLIREHALDATLSALLLDIGLQTSFGSTRLFFGPSIGYLLNPVWRSSSTIIGPDNVTFQSGSRDTVFVDQSIPNVNSLQFGVNVGIGHHIPINTSMVVVPEISVSIPFNAIRTASEWTQTSIMLGISLRWGSGAVKEEVMSKVELIDTVQIQSNERIGTVIIEGMPNISRSTQEFETHKIITETMKRTDTIKMGLPPKQSPKPSIAVFSSVDKQQGSIDQVTVTGQLVTEAFPILPMVFFSESQSSLSSNYKQLRTTEGFSSDQLEPLVTEQHKDILNIIGERLNRNPKAMIQLKGYSDPTTEKSDCSLAEQRVETIRDYLFNVWNIDKSRMSFDIDRRNCMPENPTLSRNAQGYEENRRIEIASDSKEILSPVIRTRYVELTDFSPRELHVNTQGTIGEEITSWNIGATIGDSVLHKKDGSSIPEWLTFPLSREQARFIQQTAFPSMNISMIVQDGEGELGSTAIHIPLQRDTTNLAIQRLSLMHFPVQKASLDKQGKSAINDFLKDLEDNASISIIGYSDNLGNAQSNLELSKERAETVHRYIQSIKPKANIINVDGVGSTALPPGIKSHDLPESRFLSRTVQIEIIRTWKNAQ
ncbi:MAG: hypothetical protein FJ212_06895 [Ignavibacteria bacterium]|nr:hypothetical protein [Ignavibacteria bacterium]